VSCVRAALVLCINPLMLSGLGGRRGAYRALRFTTVTVRRDAGGTRLAVHFWMRVNLLWFGLNNAGWRVDVCMTAWRVVPVPSNGAGWFCVPQTSPYYARTARYDSACGSFCAFIC